MSLFSRSLEERKGQRFYWVYVVISLLCTAALITGFAFSNRLAGLLPQATWFVIVFVIAVWAATVWFGRWLAPGDPLIRWINRLLPKRPPRP
jgi:Kef-type K+ transport system membrane component KefB